MLNSLRYIIYTKVLHYVQSHLSGRESTSITQGLHENPLHPLLTNSTSIPSVRSDFLPLPVSVSPYPLVPPLLLVQHTIVLSPTSPPPTSPLGLGSETLGALLKPETGLLFPSGSSFRGDRPSPPSLQVPTPYTDIRPPSSGTLHSLLY